MKKKNLLFKAVALTMSLVLLSGCAGKENPETEPTPEPSVEATPAPEPEEEKPEKDFDQDRSQKGENGGVASASEFSSKIGVDILKAGGNAVDAAVATAFAIGAYEPFASGVGGGGLMLIHLEDGTETFIEFREMAPAAATDDMYPLDEEGDVIDRLNSRGGKAVGIPGEVAGLLLALEKYGTMTPAEVIQPTIDACRAGIPITENFASAISDKFEWFEQYEGAKEVYYDPSTGLPWEFGDTIINEPLAQTLEIIAAEGRDGFYKGELAEKIIAEVEKTGGIMTMEDLASYQANERPVIKAPYREEFEVLTVTPPSSGGAAILQLLNIMEHVDLPNMEYNQPETIHFWREAMKMAFADRAEFMGDSDYVEVPLQGLVDKDYAKELFDTIDPEKPSPDVTEGDPWKYESGNTTHLSAMDKNGNAVSLTKTVNDYFGSCVIVPGTGIVLNNEMLDFNAEPDTANSVEAGKRPLSSMTPTMVLKEGKPFLVLGSPGGMRIITHVATTLSKVVDHKMPLQEAINSPRIYSTHTSDLWINPSRYPEATITKLKEMGHEFNEITWSGTISAVMLEDGEFTAAGDSRLDGQGIAY